MREQAIVIEGNPHYTDNNRLAYDFYDDIVVLLMEYGLDAIRLPGVPGVRPDKTHPRAKLWIAHSMGTERLRFAGPDVRVLMLGVPEGLYHPKDDACIIQRCPKGWQPNEFHYTLTQRMVDEITELARDITHRRATQYMDTKTLVTLTPDVSGSYIPMLSSRLQDGSSRIDRDHDCVIDHDDILVTTGNIDTSTSTNLVEVLLPDGRVRWIEGDYLRSCS